MDKATLPEQIDQAWSLLRRDPAGLVPAALQILRRAGPASPHAGTAWLLLAWGRRFRGQNDRAAAALARATQHARRRGDSALQCNCRDLQAMALTVQGRPTEALALLADNDQPPGSQRHPRDQAQTALRRAHAHNLLGQRDEGLRALYAALAAARRSNDGSLTAQALAALGGQHADLHHLDEAERLCAQAAALADSHGAEQTWALATLNRLNALVNLGRGAEGLADVQRLQQAEPRLNQRARAHRLIVYADVLQQAGQRAQAQALLDDSLRLQQQGARHPLSWTTCQVKLWTDQGRWAEARQLAQDWLAQPDHGDDPALVPSEQLQLLHSLVRCCEAQGDLAAALHWHRQAYRTHEALVGRSARAARLALEVEHQLERERHSRAEAQRQHDAAEAERRRLDALNQALQQAGQAKTRFLAAASHDLRQPVQALNLYLAALQTEDLGDSAARLVQRLAQAQASLAGLFDTLLDVSRIDAGVVPVHLQAVPLGPLLQRLADEARPAAQARGLGLRLHLPRQAAREQVLSDPALLERCLRNLLDNALKYTHRGRVLLAARPQGRGWRVQVLDTGIGMDAATQAQAFDEFFQADNSARDRQRGLGLGLSIVQRLAGLLGHPLVLRSRAGHGTAVQLLLAAAPATAPAPPAASPPAAAHDTATLTLAVVDDDTDVRQALTTLLERWGHRVIAAPDDTQALQAWAHAGSPPVHALLVDFRLGSGLTGVQVCQALRQRWGRHLPALVLTGDSAPERLQQLHDSGLPWLSKPVLPLRLRSWLHAVAAARQLPR